MIKIEVCLKAEDIAEGDPSDPTNCPVQRALSRDASWLGGSWRVTKDYLVWIHDGGAGSDVKWPTPWGVSEWIKSFDKHKGVDRTGWRLKLIGSRFQPIKFSIKLHDLSEIKTSLTWFQDVELSIEKRRGTT